MKSVAILSAVAATASAAAVTPRTPPAAGELSECSQSAYALFSAAPTLPAEAVEFSSSYYQTHTRTTSVIEENCAFITAIPESVDYVLFDHNADVAKYNLDNAKAYAAATECLGGDSVHKPCSKEWAAYYSVLAELPGQASPTPTPGAGPSDNCEKRAVEFFDNQPDRPTDLAQFSSAYYATATATAGASATAGVDRCAYLAEVPESVDAVMAKFFAALFKYEDDNMELFDELMECLRFGEEGSVATVQEECSNELAAYQLSLSEKNPDCPAPKESPEAENPQGGEETPNQVHYEGGESPETVREGSENTPEVPEPEDTNPAQGGNGTSTGEEPVQAGASGMKIATVAAAIISSVIGLALF